MNGTNFPVLAATMALFNISLKLEFSAPTTAENFQIQNFTSTPKILEKQNLSWNDIIGLSFKTIQRDWLEEVEIWYMPLMSKNAGRQWRQYFTGRNDDLKEWENFCGTEIWEDPIAILKGFNETQAVKCYADRKSGRGAWNCTYWTDKMEVKPMKAGSALSFTDNKTFLVEIRVWEDQTRDWVVYSTDKNLTEDSLQNIQQHLTQIGFEDKEETLKIDYSKCKELF